MPGYVHDRLLVLLDRDPAVDRSQTCEMVYDEDAYGAVKSATCAEIAPAGSIDMPAPSTRRTGSFTVRCSPTTLTSTIPRRAQIVGSRDEVVDWFAANFGVIPWSMHYITNIES